MWDVVGGEREKEGGCRLALLGLVELLLTSPFVFFCRVHSVPLRFSCTFFQSILEGNWAESSTAQFRSGSPSTISRLSISSSTFTYTSTSTSSDPLPTDDLSSSLYIPSHESDLGAQTGQDSSTETEERPSTSFSEVSNATTGAASEGAGTERRKKKKKPKKKKAGKREPDGVYASISLPGEEALAFHDFRSSAFFLPLLFSTRLMGFSFRRSSPPLPSSFTLNQLGQRRTPDPLRS